MNNSTKDVKPIAIEDVLNFFRGRNTLIDPTADDIQRCKDFINDQIALQETVPQYDPNKPVPPIFRANMLYGRPKLIEEAEFYRVAESTLSLKPVDEQWKVCLPGAGSNKSDFIGKGLPDSAYLCGYDVKHKPTSTHAHDARYIATMEGNKYNIYDVLRMNEDKLKPEISFDCRTRFQIATDLGISPLLINIDELKPDVYEAKVRQYFFLD